MLFTGPQGGSLTSRWSESITRVMLLCRWSRPGGPPGGRLLQPGRGASGGDANPMHVQVRQPRRWPSAGPLLGRGGREAARSRRAASVDAPGAHLPRHACCQVRCSCPHAPYLTHHLIGCYQPSGSFVTCSLASPRLDSHVAELCCT